ncbi:tRNA pseudouridine(55) synthase TruB [Methylogaea oryzae]|uniref:tRNA pseudouridine(55) synthase TruB n=1 Tax=Methylogaea oryzae TaxID=1295382 RepID=UPI000AFD3759|nr:tRNA pseudouridine(55) synthase TruB [Methylogaea oryzae]
MAQRRRNKGREVNGILLLDKTPAVTSNTTLQDVKRLFQAKKAGHTGSLDPLASGLLPICFGEATKLSGFLLNQDKRYEVLIRLGVTTSTADAEGEVLERKPVPALDEGLVESALARFRGDIEQVPPMYSALKHQGQRLYELARQGVEVERAARPVTIHALRLLAMTGDTLSLEVHCSKGTYVRTLAEDIGAALGCGAHVAALRRTAVGGSYSVAEAVTVTQLQSMSDEERLACLLPVDHALQDMPSVTLSEELCFSYAKDNRCSCRRCRRLPVGCVCTTS